MITDNYNISFDFNNPNKLDGNCIYLYPWDFFTGKNYPWKEQIIDNATYTIHHCACTWGKSKIDKIKKIYSNKIRCYYYSLYYTFKEMA